LLVERGQEGPDEVDLLICQLDGVVLDRTGRPDGEGAMPPIFIHIEWSSAIPVVSDQKTAIQRKCLGPLLDASVPMRRTAMAACFISGPLAPDRSVRPVAGDGDLAHL
jgi:hypothetical protein